MFGGAYLSAAGVDERTILVDIGPHRAWIRLARHDLGATMDLINKLFNLVDYTPAELMVFNIGCALWAVIYIIYIRNHRRTGFLEMPDIAAASNFAWEFLWAFLFVANMGLLINWLYKAWFVLDIYIFWVVVKDGREQVAKPQFYRHYRQLIILILIAWGLGYYFFTQEGYDTVTGLTSGLIANLAISAMYPFMMLARKDFSSVSHSVAWLKMIGTGLITLFTFMHFQEAYFIKTMGIVVLVLDLYYIYLYYQRRRVESSVVATATGDEGDLAAAPVPM